MIGCASKRDITKGPEEDLDLQYRLAEDDVLKYRTSSSFVRTVTVRGRPLELTASETRDFSVKSEGRPGGNLSLLLTIESMDIRITGPQGEIASDVGGVTGRSFEMTISTLGEELDISGADTIEYDVGPQGKRSIESQFSPFFPDLPGTPVGVKDSWRTESTVTEKGMSTDLTVAIKSDNTLVGFETVHGFKCAKMTAPFTGTLKGKGEEQGVELITDAAVTGMSTWYFAYQEGVYVKEVSTGTAEGTITAMAPEKMDIPLKRDFKIEVTLLE